MNENAVNENAVYERLLTFLSDANVSHRLVEHSAEGRTDLVSVMRGNRLEQAAKAMVLMVSLGKKSRQYVLAVVGGDRRIDFKAIREIFRGSYVGLAPKEKAEELTGCVLGSVPPFSFHPELKLVADRRLLSNQEIVFNAGRLDRSIFLAVDAYVAVARPAIYDITQEVSP